MASEQDEKKLIQLIEDRLEYCLDAKSDRMEEAMVVLMAYSGFSIDKSRDFAKNDHHSQLPHWFTDKVVLNVLQPIARTAASIITANNPTWIVEPVGETASKYQAARGVQKLLDYFYRSNGVAKTLDDIALRATLSGYAGFFVDWDSQIGRGSFSDTSEGREGWFVIEPVDIFNLHFEPGVGGVDNAFWCIKESTMHVEEARLYFNNAGIDFEKDRLTHEDGTVKRHLKIVSDIESSNESIEDDSQRVRVLHYWQKPGHRYPKGLEVIVAGNKIVHMEDSLLMGEFPIYMMRFIAESHRDYGSGLGSALLQLQRDMTMTWNGVRARRDQEVRPPWFVPVGSTTRGINTYPGAINEINPRTAPPAPIKFDPMSQAVGGFGDRTMAMMEYIAGINDASRGEAPTSNATGRLTAFLAELDNRKLGPTVRSMSSMLSRLGKRMVRLWQKYGGETITVTVLGHGHAAEVSEIRREDVLWNDIDVAVSSMMPRQQPLRQETILNLIQMGVIGREQALDALEFGGFDEAMGLRSTEALNARSQNEDLADIGISLEDVPVIEEEDHETHIREHSKYLILEHPGNLIHARFAQHIQMHKDAVQQKQIKEIQMQQAVQMAAQSPPPGPPGGGGGGGGLSIAGSTAKPGGIPPSMATLQEPGVDKKEEADLASRAGIE